MSLSVSCVTLRYTTVEKRIEVNSLFIQLPLMITVQEDFTFSKPVSESTLTYVVGEVIRERSESLLQLRAKLFLYE